MNDAMIIGIFSYLTLLGIFYFLIILMTGKKYIGTVSKKLTGKTEGNISKTFRYYIKNEDNEERRLVYETGLKLNIGDKVKVIENKNTKGIYVQKHLLMFLAFLVFVYSIEMLFILKGA